MSEHHDIETHDNDHQPEHHSERPVVTPRVDIYENEEAFLVVADLPGVRSDDVSIHLDSETLTLEGAFAAGAQGDGFTYRRTFRVPRGVDADSIEARLDLGVLHLHLPKSARLKPHRIPVQAS